VPVVPRYEQQVQQSGLPSVRVRESAPVEAFGGGQAAAGIAAIGDLAMKANSLIMQEKQKADDIAAFDSITRLKEKKMDLLVNEKTGALNQKGKNAFGLPDTVPQEFDKYGQEVIDGLGNDQQRELVRRHLANEHADINDKLQVHVARERESYDKQVTTDGVKTLQNEALLNYQDERVVKSNLGLMQAAIMKAGERNGVPVEAAVQEETARVHESIIDRHLAHGNDLAAKAYFEKNKTQLGARLEDVEKVLEAEGSRGESQRQTALIVNQTGDLGHALELARNIENPNIQDMTVSRVKEHFGAKKAAIEERSENQLNGVLKQLELSKGRYEFPSKMLGTMKTEHIKAFELRKKQLMSGEDAAPNGMDFYDLRTRAATPELQDGFKNEYLLKYAAKMPPSELSKLIEIQADLRKGSGKSDKILGQFRTQNETINSVLTAHKIDVSPKPGSADSTLVEKMRTQVELDSVQFASDTGKAPTNADIQKMAERYLVKVTLKEHWYGDEKAPRLLLRLNQSGTIKFGDIPSGDRDEVEAALRLERAPVSPEAIEKRYNLYMNRKRK